MALNPLSDYVFFLAQFQTFAYVLLYFAVLGYKRYVWAFHCHIVSKTDISDNGKRCAIYKGLNTHSHTFAPIWIQKSHVFRLCAPGFIGIDLSLF